MVYWGIMFVCVQVCRYESLFICGGQRRTLAGMFYHMSPSLGVGSLTAPGARRASSKPR